MTIGIVGAGAMGSGMAQVAAQMGYSVWVFDAREAALETCRTKLNDTLVKLAEKGKIQSEAVAEITSRIHYTTDWTPFQACGVVIEAIVEQTEAKRAVFKALEAVVAPDAILATNTSSLSIASLSAGLQHPERFLGIHFFNPVPLMPLVEIIPGVATHPEVVQRATQLMQAWGKTTVACKDTPGFIVNRVARPFYSESIKMMEEGLGSCAEIDAALKSAGFRMGPFELMDFIGHDVNYTVTETVWTQFFYDPRFRPSITQKRLLEAGWLGRKSGRGFYDYRQGPLPTVTVDPQWAQGVVNRVLALLINEAADALLQGICTEEDLERAMTKGVNYPKGLLAWGREWGLNHAVAELERLHAWYGDDRYRVNPWLRRAAQ
jgi:3-hydroxybutyryl-CoA dehydrogenase